MLSLNVPLWQDSYRSEQQQAVSEATSIEQQRVEAENNILAKSAQDITNITTASKESGFIVKH